MALEKERWQRIERILDEALELPKPEIPAFLDQACAGDGELRREVEGFLAAESQAGSFLEAWAADFASTLKLDPADSPSQALPDDLPQLGPYRIVSKIGSGAMGVVFEAEDTRLKRRVALKLLPPAVGADTQAKERFLREARSISALDHPNLCTVHDIGETEDGLVYLVMTYYGRQTLAHRIAQGPLAVEEALDLAIQIARGLERAHEAGVIHRDVKPANVLVTERGEARIVDFGIAKVLGEVALSRTGTSPGTPAYMSPEQAGGEELDPRTDLWALGAVLYEMLAGRKPFGGKSLHSMLQAIRYRDPEPLSRWRDDVPEALRAVVSKALRKEREKRYASATEMLADLEAARPRAARTSSSGRPGWRRLLAAAAVLALLGLGGGWWAWHRTRLSPVSSIQQKKQTSLAVLYFQNLNSDPELDWLRHGIPEMLVTDLSQSPGIDVLSTGRLYQILKELNALEQPTLPFELVRTIAQRSAVPLVVQGSYARVSGVLRITFAIEEAATGKILRSQSVEGPGEESLFALVDQLSASIRGQFEVSRAPETPVTVAMVTTSSLEAWRLRSQAVALAYESKPREALGLLKQAVEIDPTFALALSEMGKIYGNLGESAQAREATRKALELAERLPLDQRYGIAASFYSTSWSTYHQAIEVYEQALRIYPERQVWRAGLALRYAFLERYQAAIEEYERLLEAGTTYPGNFTSAANAYAALGQFEKGRQLLVDAIERNPDNWRLRWGLGWHLTEWGRLEEAAAPFAAAAELAPGEVLLPYSRWRLATLRQDWEKADLEARRVAEHASDFGHWRGAVSRARLLLYRGRSAEALARFDEAATAPSDPAFMALALCWKADLLLQRGEAAPALAAAERAQVLGKSEWPELLGLFFAALAEEQLGRPAETERIEETLRYQSTLHGNVVEERQLHYLEGLLALSRGDTREAVQSLSRAASLLPPKGVEFHWHVYPDHVPIWLALGRAELAAGNPRQALTWLGKATAGGSEHLEKPVYYVRSFYFQGLALEQLGETGEARESYRRFLGYWAAGDLDPEKLEKAAASLQ